MVRQAATGGLAGRRFVFTDFSKTPGEVCESLLAAFRPKTSSGRPVRSARYRTGRNLLAGLRFPDEQRPVIVLDNAGRMTRQQLTFLRELNLEKGYLFIAIVESFLSERSLFLLRACLFPSETIVLGHLPIRSALEYFQRFADKHGLGFTSDDLLFLAKSSGGYPLGMRETAERLRKKSGGKPDPSPTEGARSCGIRSDERLEDAGSCKGVPPAREIFRTPSDEGYRMRRRLES
jgi:hypothetical protein